MFVIRPRINAITLPTFVFGSLAMMTLIGISSDHALAACPSCHPQGSNVVVSCLDGNEFEMSIAINPINPDNLVIAAHAPKPFQPPDDPPLNTFYSCDGGLTWTLKSLDVNVDGIVGVETRFDPTVAIDEGGNVYVGYGAHLSGFERERKLIIAKSTDGGQTYPSFAVVDGPASGLDKWIVNTGPDPFIPNQQNVYVAYTHIKTFPPDPPDPSLRELHLAASYDGGACFPTNEIVNDALALSSGYGASGGMPAVAEDGRLYVVWNEWDPINLSADPPVLPGDFARIKIDFSVDGGRTFNIDKLIQCTRVSPGHPNNIPGGARYAIPAQPHRGIVALPSIAIDRSGGGFNGRIYVAYTVVKDPAPDPIDPFDTDIEVAYIDKVGLIAGGEWIEGAEWQYARVNDDATAMSQFNPWLDVDPMTGQVVIMWLDARNDPNNEQVEVFIGLSDDGGANWRNRRVSDGPSEVAASQADIDFAEYNGVAIFDSVVHAAWADNSCDLNNELDIFSDTISWRFVDAAAQAGGDGKSWATAYQFLRDALSDAAADSTINEVRVAQGTYMPDGGFTPVGGTHTAGSGDRGATFQLVSGVAVRGGFGGLVGSPADPNLRNLTTFETTLSGDLANDDVASVLELSSGDTSRVDNSYHVVTGSGTGPTAILDGFTIRGGNADTDSAQPDGWGGGMLNFDANVTSSPTVLNCTFTDNRAFIGGGVLNQNGDPHVINCRFLANAAISFGGGLCNDQLGAQQIVNCLFKDNLADAGGAVVNAAGSPTLINCTISGNTATGSLGVTGGIWNHSDANVTITNCIVWGNTDDQETVESAQIDVFGSPGATLNVTFSCIQDDNPDDSNIPFCVPNCTGSNNGNIDDDPRFLDDDLHLFSDSPCIDVGDDDAVPFDTGDVDGDGDFIEPTPDLDGKNRIVDGDGTGDPAAVVDMGAYELDCDAPCMVSADSIKFHANYSGPGFWPRKIATGHSECRATGGAATLEFVFDEAVYSDDGDNFVAGDFTIQNGTVNTVTFSFDRKTLTLQCNGVENGPCLDISFVVRDVSANSVGLQFGWLILLGDANDDGVVDVADQSVVIAEDTNTATSTNFRCDLDKNGLIEADAQGSHLDLDLVTW